MAKMTMEQILADIYCDRVKKVILDNDAGCEFDDQYAIVHAMGSPKIELLSLTSALYACDDYPFDVSQEHSFEANKRIVNVTHTDYPVYRGADFPVSSLPVLGPMDSPAAQNIIKTAMEADELIYVLVTGAITNVASAIMLEPAIKEKICVIWIAANCFDLPNNDEYNLTNDYKAGQYILNCGVPLVLVPTFSGIAGRGTASLVANKETFKAITTNSDAGVFFRETWPAEFDDSPYSYTHGGKDWRRVIWDVAVTGVLTIPDKYTFSIIPTPVFTDDIQVAYDSTRHKMIYMDTMDAKAVFADVFDAINRM
ncbi:MAG: hypothetical protein E7658_04890 [Ruminococcaceae bacterium]|nr:hypothetical protein [Oscillospiraceae bacterium]